MQTVLTIFNGHESYHVLHYHVLFHDRHNRNAHTYRRGHCHISKVQEYFCLIEKTRSPMHTADGCRIWFAWSRGQNLYVSNFTHQQPICGYIYILDLENKHFPFQSILGAAISICINNISEVQPIVWDQSIIITISLVPRIILISSSPTFSKKNKWCIDQSILKYLILSPKFVPETIIKLSSIVSYHKYLPILTNICA